MVKRGNPSPSRGVSRQVTAAVPASAARRPPEPITEENIDRIEKETIAEVSRAITVLESVIAQWDALEKKPEDIKGDFTRYKRFHEALTEWETRILRSASGELDLGRRIHRLGEFVKICNVHA
jgi:hypothetical protein